MEMGVKNTHREQAAKKAKKQKQNEQRIERTINRLVDENDVLGNLSMSEKLAELSKLCEEKAVHGAIDYYTMKAKEAKVPTFRREFPVTLHHEYILNGIKKWTAERIGKRSKPCNDELPNSTKVIEVN